MDSHPFELRTCLINPPQAIFDAARYLDDAVTAHLAGKRTLACELIRLADIEAITEWVESLWGKGGPFSRPFPVENLPPRVAPDQRFKPRMPNKAGINALLARDGFHCRFCGIPLVRRETRSLIRKAYPDELRWGKDNPDKHTAFQAMALSLDHLLPHSRGGTNELSNMLVACGPCNCGRAELTLEQVRVAIPRPYDPTRSTWDGLERFR